MHCLFALIPTLALAACANHRARFSEFEYRGVCGNPTQEAAGWAYVGRIPASAAALRSLADATPLTPEGNDNYAVESWYTSRDSALMLCRTDQAPKDSCVTTWWSFRIEEGEWRIFDKGAFICVT